LQTLEILVKNPILIRHLGLIHNVWLVWQNLMPDPIADQNENSLQETDCKKDHKIQSYATSIIDRDLGLVTKRNSSMKHV
jgi:hypothetical protein